MIKFALIGCGRIAQKHAELIGGGRIKNAKLVAVCDLKIIRAKKIALQFNCEFYSNLDDMMKNNKIDVVSVLTESGNHYRNVISLSKYNSHVIVEKPIALKVEDAQRMIALYKRKKLKLFVVKQNRFNPSVIKLKEAVDKKMFGKIFLGTIRVRWKRDNKYYNMDKWRGSWKLDGGVLANQAIHHIDLLIFLMGDVHSVYAKSIRALSKKEAEDTAVVILKFKSGALGVIEATTATRPKDIEGSVSILGSKGTVELGGFAVNEIKTWEFAKSHRLNKKKYFTNPPNVYGFGHKKYYEHVLDYLENKSKRIIDGIEGVKSLMLVNCIYKSIEENKEIIVKNNNSKSKLGR